MAWLTIGRLDIPTRGDALLWSLAVVVLGLALVEALVGMRPARRTFEP